MPDSVRCEVCRPNGIARRGLDKAGYSRAKERRSFHHWMRGHCSRVACSPCPSLVSADRRPQSHAGRLGDRVLRPSWNGRDDSERGMDGKGPSESDMGSRIYHPARAELQLCRHGPSLKPVPEGCGDPRASTRRGRKHLHDRVVVSLPLHCRRLRTDQPIVDMRSGIDKSEEMAGDRNELENELNHQALAKQRTVLEGISGSWCNVLGTDCISAGQD